MAVLPITKVVLYKHGVGYFERQGEVEGDATIDLHFKAAEMNDVLKSLTTLDLDHGRIASMSYESTRPIEKQLEDISIHLDDDSSLTRLLAQVKGARVMVELGSRVVEGSVAGIQTITRRQDDAVVHVPYLVLLLDGGMVQTFDLTETKQISFLDEPLRKDLQHLLEVLIGSKKKDLKKLTIFTRGQGTRKILAGYIVETPVWKTSYRVLLDEGSPALLQGWALVDNTQDDDWEDVSLSLVAGLPISFVHDLYSPRYKKRPVVEVQEEEAYAPPLLEEGMSWGAPEMEMPAPEPPSMQAMGALPGSLPGPVRGICAPAASRSVEVQTRTVEVSDLFQYDIQIPVTVKRGQSALVPILQGPFEGKRVAVYNRGIRDRNPMSAILFKNTTGLTLEGGPVTVFENGSYVGESMLESMQPDEERLVPFSIELGAVVALDDFSRTQDVSKAVVSRGMLTLERFRLTGTTYTIKNKTARALDLFLEHVIIEGTTLVDTPDPVEKTPGLYRFRFGVPAKAQTGFRVTERRDDVQQFHLGGVGERDVGAWVQARYLDDATASALRSILHRREAAAALQVRVQEREAELREIFDNQERLRKNLQALGTTQDERSLRERYVGQMAADEDRVAAFREELKKWNSQLRTMLDEINQSLQELHFETLVGAQEEAAAGRNS